MDRISAAGGHGAPVRERVPARKAGGVAGDVDGDVARVAGLVEGAR